jgi:hypothetical protein
MKKLSVKHYDHEMYAPFGLKRIYAIEILRIDPRAEEYSDDLSHPCTAKNSSLFTLMKRIGFTWNNKVKAWL